MARLEGARAARDPLAACAGAHHILTTQKPPAWRGTWRDDAEARAVYSEAAGIGRALPRAIAVPADADDLAVLVTWASETDTPLIPRGSGSSMAGGAIGDGVIVDVSRMRHLAPVDRNGRSVRAEVGVLRDEIERAAKVAGLRLPVDPSSGAFCTVGGMAATNASGAHSLRHGSVRPWVLSLDCVFADGTKARVTRGAAPPAVPAIAAFLAARGGFASPRAAVRKNSSGYDPGAELIDILVGSEGTLAIFTSVELSLIPRAGGTCSILAAFPQLEEASAGAAISRDHGAVACELLDRTFVDIARDGGSQAAAGIPPGMEAVLLIEVEADDSSAAALDASALALKLEEAGAAITIIALTAEDEHHLWSLRHAASPILSRLDPALKSMQFIEDGAVPPDRLADYVRAVRAALDRVGIRGVIFGHAGDAHVHVNPLVDVRMSDWRVRMEALFQEICSVTTALGGTMSGEHGDGRLRAPVLGAVLGEDAARWARLVKNAFDPRGILNPGVKVPLAGQRPIDAVKYDPALPPLPPRAARALDFIAEHRAYSRFRLELLNDVSDAPSPSVARSDPAD